MVRIFLPKSSFAILTPVVVCGVDRYINNMFEVHSSSHDLLPEQFSTFSEKNNSVAPLHGLPEAIMVSSFGVGCHCLADNHGTYYL